MTEAVLERALPKEMTGHLGHENHDPAGLTGPARPRGEAAPPPRNRELARPPSRMI